jgi:hypothetical protein
VLVSRAPEPDDDEQPGEPRETADRPAAPIPEPTDH